MLQLSRAKPGNPASTIYKFQSTIDLRVPYPVHACISSACVCVNRPSWLFGACVHHSSVRIRLHTCHSSHRFSACVHRSPVHACTYAGRPPRLRVRIICVYQLRVSLSVHAHIIRACVCTCVHRPCAHVCAHSRRHRISACVCTVLCVCVRNTMFLQSVFAKRRACNCTHAAERSSLR